MILSVEDRLEILDLYARHAHFHDAGEADRWAALFTPDGTLTVRPGLAALPEGLEERGTAELAAHCRRTQERIKKGETHHEVHAGFNIVIEATETGAKGMAYQMAVRVGVHQPPQVANTGRFLDELVKGVDGWRFRSRTFVPDL